MYRYFVAAPTLVAMLMLVIPHLTHAQARSICESPRTYSIAAIDPRFGIATSTLLSALQDAEKIWEVPAQRDIFTYTESGGLIAVSLLYDDRQIAIVKMHSQELVLAAIKKAFAALEASYTDTVRDTQSAMQANADRFAMYSNDMNTLNADIERANAAGGASPTEFAQLQSRKDVLQNRFTDLKATETQLNATATSLNAISTSLNAIVLLLNNFVKQHNDDVARSGGFEQGYYRRAGTDESIGIYAFADQSQLTRVLAHELGHSLGLQHVSDPDAIMHESNQGLKLEATAADLGEFQKVCKQ